MLAWDWKWICKTGSSCETAGNGEKCLPLLRDLEDPASRPFLARDIDRSFIGARRGRERAGDSPAWRPGADHSSRSHGRSVRSREKFAQILKKTRFLHGDAKISSRGRYNGLMVKFSPGRVVTVRDRHSGVLAQWPLWTEEKGCMTGSSVCPIDWQQQLSAACCGFTAGRLAGRWYRFIAGTCARQQMWAVSFYLLNKYDFSLLCRLSNWRCSHLLLSAVRYAYSGSCCYRAPIYAVGRVARCLRVSPSRHSGCRWRDHWRDVIVMTWSRDQPRQVSWDTLQSVIIGAVIRCTLVVRRISCSSIERSVRSVSVFNFHYIAYDRGAP